MRRIKKLFGIAAALVAFAAGAQAQTAVFVASGSSALFLEAGQAAASATTATPPGMGAVCIWSQSGGLATSLTVTDVVAETGNAWIAWTPGTANNTSTCGTISSKTLIYAYVQTDSTVGTRLYFNGGKIGFVSTNPSGSAPSGLIFGTSGEQALNATVWGLVSGKALTAAGTDIRPEDAKFATVRANTNCGTEVDSSAYLGLGYAFGTSIHSYFGSNSVHVENFTLPTSGYTAIPIGATPIVFAVNPSNTTNGFGTGVSDASPTTLAEFLSGAYGSTNDLSGAAGDSPVTTLIEDPLEGDYNTVEYTTVAASGLKLSQDEGNCNGTVPRTNPLHLASNDGSGGYRDRVIGTGEAVKEILAVRDAFGYAFWSAASWKNATATTARYLTVDGYDPLYNRAASNYSTTRNTIPTTGNGYLPDVTFTDLNNGNYPVWSVLRFVTASSGINFTWAYKLAERLQGFISSTTQPDFIPAASMNVWRSHFNPPGQSVTPNNGSAGAGLSCGTEAGGDVGGVILDPASCTTGERQ